MSMPALMAASAVIAAAFATTPAAAQTARVDRFEMTPVDGGFLRLDRDSGATAFCSASGDGYVCRPAGEDPVGSEAEVKRLEARVAALEEQLKSRGSSGLPTVPALPKDGQALKDDPSLALPTDKQIDDIATFFERAIRRMKKLAAELEKDAPPDEQRL